MQLIYNRSHTLVAPRTQHVIVGSIHLKCVLLYSCVCIFHTRQLSGCGHTFQCIFINLIILRISLSFSCAYIFNAPVSLNTWVTYDNHGDVLLKYGCYLAVNLITMTTNTNLSTCSACPASTVGRVTCYQLFILVTTLRGG